MSKYLSNESNRVKAKGTFPPFDWRGLPGTVIGVDEVGRGCLAGRVYAAAVILQSEEDIKHYTDSKLLSEKRREELFISITTRHKFGIAFASAEEVDRVNILNASHLAMVRAIRALKVKTGHVLVDGHLKIRGLRGFEQTPLVKGDLRAAPISAASIIAKVSRDRYARELATLYPEYGFEQHKGYPTDQHREALRRVGPSPEHRRTFEGVREFFPEPEQLPLP